MDAVTAATRNGRFGSVDGGAMSIDAGDASVHSGWQAEIDEDAKRRWPSVYA